MAVIKCAGCGALVEIPNGKNFIFCSECGTKCEASATPMSSAFLKRGFLALEDGEWKNANNFFEQALNENPECANAYLGKLLADLKCKTKEDLKNCAKPFDGNNNCSKVMRFASDELKSEIEGYIEFINNRNSADALEKAYLAASKVANGTKSIKKLKNTRERLIALGDYKDAPQLADMCDEKISSIVAKNSKNEVKSIKLASILSTAVALLIVFTIVLTTIVIPTIKYNKAKEAFDKGDYKNAIVFFGDNYNAKDNASLFAECLKNIAVNDTFAAGGYHTVALKNDGTVLAVGKTSSYYTDYYDPCDVSNWTDIIAVDAGDYHTVGLKADGTVVAVGDTDAYETYSSYSGELIGSTDNFENIVAISAGNDFTAALNKNGTVVVAGDYDFGVYDLRNIIAISAGNDFLLGLTTHGTVVAVGDSSAYEYSYDDDYSYFDDDLYYDNYNCESVADWKDIVAISAGQYHSVGLKADGTVVAMGDNEYGQCNVEKWTDIVAIAAGYDYTIGLKKNGTVVIAGELFDEEINGDILDNAIAISANEHHFVAMKSDGTLVAVGNDDYNQCNVTKWKNIKRPQ